MEMNGQEKHKEQSKRSSKGIRTRVIRLDNGISHQVRVQIGNFCSTHAFVLFSQDLTIGYKEEILRR